MSKELFQKPALQFRDQYQGGDPFPHVVIQDLFEKRTLEKILEEFPADKDSGWRGNRDAWEFKQARNRLDELGPETRGFLQFMNSSCAIAYLEQMTGIQGLIPDPYYWGGGLHQIQRGGFLKVHADFNWHATLRLHRRINLLIYLNRDWQEDYGGHLELWDSEMKSCRQSILPVFNRTVIFNTTSCSYHGHPKPLSCPQGMSRRSIALYYYTSERPEQEVRGAHTTLFQRTPGERWNLSLKQRVSRLLTRWTPPVLYETYKRRKIRSTFENHS